jgi:hypothetical protein
MTVKNMVVVGSIVCIAVGIFIWVSRTLVARAEVPGAQEASTEPWNARFLRIEEKAKAAETDDPDSVRALADEVFGQAHRFGTLPMFVKKPVEEQVIQAELDYRKGVRPAVTHSDVTRLINSLSDRLGLPSYARTNDNQILDMRFRSVQLTPRFMGKGLSKSEDGTPLSPGDSVNFALSPLQASHLVMFAIDAKLGNPEYQMAPNEWENSRYQKTLETWQRYQKEGDVISAEESSKSQPRLVTKVSKRMELTRAAEAHLLKLTPKESIDLAQSALETLGVAPAH